MNSDRCRDGLAEKSKELGALALRRNPSGCENFQSGFQVSLLAFFCNWTNHSDRVSRICHTSKDPKPRTRLSQLARHCLVPGDGLRKPSATENAQSHRILGFKQGSFQRTTKK